MIFKAKQLIGLLVQTLSGQDLGQLKDLVINTDNSQIIKYIVAPSKLVAKILNSELIVDQSQIIEITEQKIIVADNTVADPAVVEAQPQAN